VELGRKKSVVKSKEKNEKPKKKKPKALDDSEHDNLLQMIFGKNSDQ